MHWAINATGSAIWVIFLFYELRELITDIYLSKKTVVDGKNLNFRFIIKAFKSVFHSNPLRDHVYSMYIIYFQIYEHLSTSELK